MRLDSFSIFRNFDSGSENVDCYLRSSRKIFHRHCHVIGQNNIIENIYLGRLLGGLQGFRSMVFNRMHWSQDDNSSIGFNRMPDVVQEELGSYESCDISVDFSTRFGILHQKVGFVSLTIYVEHLNMVCMKLMIYMMQYYILIASSHDNLKFHDMSFM
jgi:hypothetical protein